MEHYQALEEALETPDFLVLSGSRLYGTNLPDSDYDYRGFVIPPFEYLVGIYRFDQQVLKVPDQTVWSMVKYVRQLLDGDPNSIELLFAPTDNIINMSPFAHRLIELRTSFLSKRILRRVFGYASSEKHHFEKDPTAFKRASHCIRLLHQAVEIFNSHTLTFPRENACDLKAIKAGDKDLFEIRFETLFSRVSAMQHETVLPDNAPVDEINKLVREILADHLMRRDQRFFGFFRNSSALRV